MTVGVEPDGDLTLDWGASCLAAGGDYVVYEGSLGNFTTHTPVTCSTGGAATWTLNPSAGSSYYIVSPTDGIAEGSHGRDGSGAERPVGSMVCYQQSVGVCP